MKKTSSENGIKAALKRIFTIMLLALALAGCGISLEKEGSSPNPNGRNAPGASPGTVAEEPCSIQQ